MHSAEERAERRVESLSEALGATIGVWLATELSKAAGGPRGAMQAAQWSAKVRGLVEAWDATLREVVSAAVSEGAAEVAAWAESSGAPVPTPSTTMVSDIWRPSHVVPEELLFVSPLGEVRDAMAEYEAIVGRAHQRMVRGGAVDDVVREALEEMGTVTIVHDGRHYDPRGYVTNRVMGEWAREMQDLRDEAGRAAGMDAVEVSAHALCAEDHLPYQGRIWTNVQMAEIQASLDRPIAQGYNCRHILLPCWSDDEPTHSPEELALMEARSLEPVEVQGATMTRYQATQWQRSKEREVRRAKLEAKVAEAAGGDPSKARERARRLSREYREGSAQAGLEPDPRRLRVPTLA